jgi:hypothetical protein
MREWRKIPKNRNYNRDYQRKKRHSKIYKPYAWCVTGLIILKKSDKTIKVEPLNIRSNVSQKILEISGLD